LQNFQMKRRENPAVPAAADYATLATFKNGSAAEVPSRPSRKREAFGGKPVQSECLHPFSSCSADAGLRKKNRPHICRTKNPAAIPFRRRGRIPLPHPFRLHTLLTRVFVYRHFPNSRTISDSYPLATPTKHSACRLLPRPLRLHIRFFRPSIHSAATSASSPNRPVPILLAV